jgi:hypothetical protein
LTSNCTLGHLSWAFASTSRPRGEIFRTTPRSSLVLGKVDLPPPVMTVASHSDLTPRLIRSWSSHGYRDFLVYSLPPSLAPRRKPRANNLTPPPIRTPLVGSEHSKALPAPMYNLRRVQHCERSSLFGVRAGPQRLLCRQTWTSHSASTIAACSMDFGGREEGSPGAPWSCDFKRSADPFILYTHGRTGRRTLRYHFQICVNEYLRQESQSGKGGAGR